MTYTITSTQNSFIKTLKTLKSKKGRVENSLFLAEGVKCAKEAIDYGFASALLTVNPSSFLCSCAEEKNIDVYIVTPAIMQTVSDSKTPQEALCVCLRRFSRKLAENTFKNHLFVALEDVSDPQNVGTIIRTADAAGAGCVLLSADCADFTSPKAIRASMGSVFHIPVITSGDFICDLKELKKAGIKLIAGHLKGSGILKKGDKNCVVIGNEARGLSDECSLLCDVLYKINIYGKAESLNAAVAAGILMYKIIDG